MNVQRRVCLIGGGGFIGSAIRNCLVQNGFNLVTIGRTLNIPLLPNETYYSIKEYTYKQLVSLMAGHPFEVIIDLAYTSVPNTSYQDPISDFSENLNNVIQHLDFAQALKAGQYIYVSSGGTVYGDHGVKPYTEMDQNLPLSPYGITKLACEHYVYMTHRTKGLNTLVIRPSNIYGPGQKPFRGQGLISTALGLALKGEPVHIFGDGSHVRDYLFIDDFCGALLDLMDKGQGGETYNIGSGAGVEINELMETVVSVVACEGITLHRKHLPERPFDVHYNVLNTDKIRSLNGWQPVTDLQSGIERTWEWIKAYMNAYEEHNILFR
jgi:UDP-glucose 4-epimerase